MPTIAAIATAQGQGGIGIVRISGPDAKPLLSKIFLPKSENFTDFKPRFMHHGLVLDCNGEPLDDVLAVFMPAPATFTGEDIAEIHCHGSAFIVGEVLRNLLRLGARQAEKGEFTRRAYINGLMDLSQAEAVAELVAAPSREALRYSLKRMQGGLGQRVHVLADELDELRAFARIGVDFPDDEVPPLSEEDFAARTLSILEKIQDLLKGALRSQTVQHGALVVLAGAVNAGKSSVLNAIAGRERALVTDIAGTTRDFIEENLDFDGLPVKLVDTAGFRGGESTTDKIEQLGIARSRELLEQADLVVVVLDGEILAKKECEAADTQTAELLSKLSCPVILLWNKCDLERPVQFPPSWAGNLPGCIASATTGENMAGLVALIRQILLDEKCGPAPDNGIAPNVRQTHALEAAARELEGLLRELENGQMYDCCLARLDTAAAFLDEILGLANNSELLDRIFENFCVGK